MNKTFLATAPIKPTLILNSRCQKAGIYLFGKPNDFGPHGDCETIMETLKFYATRNFVTDILVPSCQKFNAKIAGKKHFLEKIKFSDITLHKMVFADGVILNRHEALFIASADCPTIIATGENGMIAAHAGRNCLIDMQKLYPGAKTREHESVVDAMMEELLLAGEKAKNLKVFITCGIKAENFPHPFDHPQHGAKNEAFIKYLLKKYGKNFLKSNPAAGLICLKDLIKTQFMIHGVPRENIAADSIDTYGDNVLGNHVWHSCARGKTQEEKKRRNGVLVIRNF